MSENLIQGQNYNKHGYSIHCICHWALQTTAFMTITSWSWLNCKCLPGASSNLGSIRDNECCGGSQQVLPDVRGVNVGQRGRTMLFFKMGMWGRDLCKIMSLNWTDKIQVSLNSYTCLIHFDCVITLKTTPFLSDQSPLVMVNELVLIVLFYST